MSADARTEEAKQHVTSYTFSFGFEKTEVEGREGERGEKKEREEKKSTHTDGGRCTLQLIGLIGGEELDAGEENPPTITLPSSGSSVYLSLRTLKLYL